MDTIGRAYSTLVIDVLAKDNQNFPSFEFFTKLSAEKSLKRTALAYLVVKNKILTGLGEAGKEILAARVPIPPNGNRRKKILSFLLRSLC